MTIRWDSGVTPEESGVQFRAAFIERVPMGSRVKNSVLIPPNGGFYYGTTAEGEIYDDKESTDVNIENINGDPQLNGVWSAINLVPMN